MARSLSVKRRFSLAYLVLAGLLGVAIGTFVVLVERPAPKPPPPWSDWRPTQTDRTTQQQEIAQHVEGQYHLNSGQKLVRVVVRNPDTTTTPIKEIAVARTLNPTQTSDVYAVIDSKRTAMYILCGYGPKCSIKGGQPSVARGAVLRREALELALYTFRYVGNTDSVVAFFPPRKGEDLTHVYFFDKGEFDNQLHKPLRHTLPAAQAPVPGKFTPSERRIVDALTVRRQFRFALRPERGGGNVLVLAPGA